MPWTRIDDNFYDHPKVEAAGPLGIAMFVCGLSYCARYLTDGFILTSRVRRLIDVDDPLGVAEKLVEVGLWEHTDGGYLVHDYLEYNPSAEEVNELRDKNKRRKQLYDDPFLTRQVKARDGDFCRYCGIEVNWTDRRGTTGATYDHVDPDGPNSVDNLVVCCRGCNAKKSNRTPEEAEMPLLPLNEELSTDLIRNKSKSAIPMPIPMPIPNPETEEESAAGAAKPPTPPPKRSKTRQKKPTPEAVRVFRENAHRYPPKAWYDDVERIVGTDPPNLDFWGKVVKAYVGLGWNPTNVSGMLDFFKRDEIPDNSKPPPQRPAADYAKHATTDLPPRETSHAEREWRRVADMLKGIMAADTFDHIFRGAEPQVDGDTLIVALAGEAQRQGYTRMEQNIGRCLQSLGVAVEFR